MLLGCMAVTHEGLGVCMGCICIAVPQGTPYYVAPEVVLSGRLSKHADVYAFGIILWEMHYARRAPWREPGARLRLASMGCSYPLFNTALLGWHPDCPPAYAALAKDCVQVSLHGPPQPVHHSCALC